jgi:hypothetical protein
LSEGKRGPGRPQKYKDKAEQMRAQRAKMKNAGYKDIHASIPEEFKNLLDEFCAITGLTIPEMICYLLGCAADQAVAEVGKPLGDER